MKTKWYLHAHDEVFDLTGLLRRSLVVGPPQPVQAVHKVSPIMTVNQFDLLQALVLWATRFEPPTSVFSLLGRPFLLSPVLLLRRRRVSSSFELELSDSYSVSESLRLSSLEADSSSF